jgi:hypothetical protein
LTNLGGNSSGPKESDNRDKSLHGLMVALAMAGIIAGSVILFAYASSDSPEPADAIDTAPVAPEPEMPVFEERVTDEPAFPERIEQINSAAEVERPANADTAAGTQEERVQAHTEVEIQESTFINETGNEPVSTRQEQPDDEDEEEEEKENDPPDDLDPEPEPNEDLLDLLDDIIDIDDDETHRDNGKGKGRKNG